MRIPIFDIEICWGTKIDAYEEMLGIREKEKEPTLEEYNAIAEKRSIELGYRPRPDWMPPLTRWGRFVQILRRVLWELTLPLW